MSFELTPCFPCSAISRCASVLCVLLVFFHHLALTGGDGMSEFYDLFQNYILPSCIRIFLYLLRYDGDRIVQSLWCLGYGVNNQDHNLVLSGGGRERDFSPLTSVQTDCGFLPASWVHGNFFSGMKWSGHE